MPPTNPLKRSHSPTRAPRSHRLRAKLSPTALAPSDSSAASAISEDSALFSTDRASGHDSGSTATAHSDVEDSDISSSSEDDTSDEEESEDDSEDDSEHESDISDSDNASNVSENEMSEAEYEDWKIRMKLNAGYKPVEDADGVTRLVKRKEKPVMKPTGIRKGGELRDRLKSFLPMMAAANEELEAERKDGRLEGRVLDLGEGAEGEGEYIEMDLGLGVLEERDPDASESSNESESDNEDAKDILSKLMGQDRKAEGVGIQVVEDA